MIESSMRSCYVCEVRQWGGAVEGWGCAKPLGNGRSLSLSTFGGILGRGVLGGLSPLGSHSEKEGIGCALTDTNDAARGAGIEPPPLGAKLQRASTGGSSLTQYQQLQFFLLHMTWRIHGVPGWIPRELWDLINACASPTMAVWYMIRMGRLGEVNFLHFMLHSCVYSWAIYSHNTKCMWNLCLMYNVV